MSYNHITEGSRVSEGGLIISSRDVREDSHEMTFAKRPKEVEGMTMRMARKGSSGLGASTYKGQELPGLWRKARPAMDPSEVSTKEPTVRGHVREKGG